MGLQVYFVFNAFCQQYVDPYQTISSVILGVLSGMILCLAVIAALIEKFAPES